MAAVNVRRSSKLTGELGQAHRTQSHVRVSFDLAEYTASTVALGTLRLLEAVRELGPRCRFYQASSSEMFGASPPPQDETTRFAPQSPYACAKVFVAVV